MGLSFPKRPQRSSFGPKLVNNYPVETPNSDVGDVAFNAAFWTIAGLAGVLPRASCIATYSPLSTSFVVSHQAEAWNPNGDQAHPVLGRTNTGIYSYTFASTYLDEDGIAVPMDLKGARVTCPTISSGTNFAEGVAWVDSVFPLVVIVRVGTRLISSGVFSNSDNITFWLEVM